MRIMSNFRYNHLFYMLCDVIYTALNILLKKNVTNLFIPNEKCIITSMFHLNKILLLKLLTK